MRLEFSYRQSDLHQALAWRPHVGLGLGRVSLRRGLAGWILFVAVAIVLFFWLRQSQPSPMRSAMPQRSEIRGWIVALIPVLLILGLVWFLFIRRIRELSKKLWDSSPVFQLPHTIDVDENGIRVACALVETLYRWPYFVGWGETADLLVLLLANRARVMIPKRAASGDDALNQLRDIVQTHVHTATGGFPVGIKPALPISGAST